MQPMNQISGQIVKNIVANENIPGGVFAAFAIFDELLPLSYPSYLLPPLPPLLHLSLPVTHYTRLVSYLSLVSD